MKMSSETIFRGVSVAGFLLCAVTAVWGIGSGIFTSQEAMHAFVSGCGMLAPLLFIVFQAVQVVIPIIPGGVSCLAGVVLFGNINGFICNYVGICIGSAAAFALARHCGRPLILKIFGEKQLRRYDGWTQRDGRFDKLFALAIFLPAAPDDFLCYLAGTTAMSWKRFTAILLLGKPLAILMYSTFLGMVWKQIITWIG